MYCFALSIVNAKANFPDDSLRNPDYIDKLIRYKDYYPFIKYNVNFIEWFDNKAIDTFFYRLSQADKRKVRILHIGDSHVQIDIVTECLRNKFQKAFGYGGRGIVFPYRAANTHSSWYYRTFSEGNWHNSKNIDKEIKYDIGLSGVTIYTQDSNAWFKIVFPNQNLPDNFNVLKLFVKKSPQSFDLKVKASSDKDTIFVSCYPLDNFPFIEINLTKFADTISFFVNKTHADQSFFEFYGLIIESNKNSGILYSSVGINGAGYKSILLQSLFINQLKAYNPDLVIIDLGGNDFYKTSFVYSYMEEMLLNIIQNIKLAAPEAAIIINSSQNFYRRNINVPECAEFSKLIRNVSYKSGCAFYDYYNIAGGDKSMISWLDLGLAKKDKVHLTEKGYYLKAELFFNAFLSSYQKWLKSEYIDSLISSKIKIDSAQLSKYFENYVINKNKLVNILDNNENEKDIKIKNHTNNPSSISYIVKKGDNLNLIAYKYNVSIDDIKKWNKLNSDKILVGQKIIIYNNGNDNKQYNKSKNNTKTQSKITHKVSDGESLWIIAKKYNTTVENIKKLNKLSDNKIKPGMVLIIK